MTEPTAPVTPQPATPPAPVTTPPPAAPPAAAPPAAAPAATTPPPAATTGPTSLNIQTPNTPSPAAQTAITGGQTAAGVADETPVADATQVPAAKPEVMGWFERLSKNLTGRGEEVVKNDYQTNPELAKQTGQQIADRAAAEYKEQDWGSFMKNNWQAMLIPIGLMLSLTGNKTGKILGLLAMLGGGAGVYQRYAAITDKPFQQAVAKREIMTGKGMWTPGMEQEFQTQHGKPYQDLAFLAKHKAVDIGGKAAAGITEWANGTGEAPPSPAAPTASTP